jgi:hypothetical protein
MVSISTVPGLKHNFIGKDIAQILLLNTVLSEINISCHMKPGLRNQFLPLMTLNENNWVAKYND